MALLSRVSGEAPSRTTAASDRQAAERRRALNAAPLVGLVGANGHGSWHRRRMAELAAAGTIRLGFADPTAAERGALPSELGVSWAREPRIESRLHTTDG